MTCKTCLMIRTAGLRGILGCDPATSAYPIGRYRLMEEISSVTATELIRRHWDGQLSLPRHGGIDLQTIAEFEASHSVVLPYDFRTYVEELNGLPEARDPDGWDNVDSIGFEFLPLASFRRAEQCNRYFVFASWTLGLLDYAICLDTSGRHGEIVSVRDSLHSVAPNFSEFARMHVADSRSPYGGNPLVNASDL